VNGLLFNFDYIESVEQHIVEFPKFANGVSKMFLHARLRAIQHTRKITSHDLVHTILRCVDSFSSKGVRYKCTQSDDVIKSYSAIPHISCKAI